MEELRIILACIGSVVVVFGAVFIVLTVIDTHSKVETLLDLAQAEEDEETDEDGKDPE